MKLLPSLTLACILTGFSNCASTEEFSIAVASNFSGAIKELAAQFEHETGHSVTLVPGSTGKHFAQIMNGAPFDAFFAADRKRPRLLEENGRVVPGSRFTYAMGQIVLWSPERDLIDSSEAVLRSEGFRHLAIANPKLAPYGYAAKEVLTSLTLWNSVMDRLVRGENINQTYQFIKTGNADLGFVALSQLIQADSKQSGSYWRVPDTLYSPIEQQAVIIRDKKAVKEFFKFVSSDAGRGIIRRFGYKTP